ncbi:MAG: hypothetical protein HN404_00565 [Gemmatimonadetes bacterium]|nr:hypothetical protein [Gemmatimonadota bacterium]
MTEMRFTARHWLGALSVCLGLAGVVHAQGSAVVPTDKFIFVFDSIGGTRVNDALLAVDDVIEAYDPDGVLCGSLTITTAGQFGAMSVYGDDGNTVPDEGAVFGDEIRFEINGAAAAVTVGGPVIWTGNTNTHDIVLTATAAGGGTQTVSVTYTSGWNMISLPVVPEDATFNVLFPDAITAYEFSGGYQLVTQLSPCVGYWLHAATGGTYQISGTAVDVCDVSLPVGASMVGVPVGGTIADNVLQSPAANIVSIFTFAGGYQLQSGQDLLAEGSSFWFQLGGSGQLTLNSNTGPIAAKRLTVMRPPSEPAVSRIVATAAGGAQTMLLGVDEDALVSLPPHPPAGMLDVRAHVADMQTQHVPHSDAPAEYRLRLQGTDLRLEWDIGDQDHDRWELVLDGYAVPLEGPGGIDLGDGSMDARLRFTPRPAQFLLAPNFPNPFNPSTTIGYGLDSDGIISLRIHSLTGQAVRTLISGHQVAGRHSVVWDALDDSGIPVAAGVYICALEASSGHLVQKMVLLK